MADWFAEYTIGSSLQFYIQTRSSFITRQWDCEFIVLSQSCARLYARRCADLSYVCASSGDYE
jgi:hypothetical protein